jgi:hypothetical protein
MGKLTKHPEIRGTWRSSSSSSSSTTTTYNRVGPLVDLFWSHMSRSLFKGLPWFLLPVGLNFLVFLVINYGAFCLYVATYFFCILPKTGVMFSYFEISVFVSWSVQVYPAVFLIQFSSAAILLVSLALTVLFSLLYNLAGRASVWCSFILVCCYVFYGLNILLILPVIFKQLFHLLSMSTSCFLRFPII